MLTAGDDDWLAVVGNLGKARKSWGRLSWILIQEGADPKVLGYSYKAVAQAVLLFGAKMWVLAPRMDQALYNFQHRVACRLTGRQLSRRGGDYPQLVEEMGEAVYKGIRKSFTRRQNTVAQYIVIRPILDLCERSTQRPGARVSRRRWEQVDINLEGAKKRESKTATVLELDSHSDSNPDQVRE